VPDDDILAIGGSQDVLFGLGEACGVRRGATDGRDRKQHLALPDIQHEETGAIDGHEQDGDPFDDGHDDATRPLFRVCTGSAAIS
jgi:hypothetical protein